MSGSQSVLGKQSLAWMLAVSFVKIWHKIQGETEQEHKGIMYTVMNGNIGFVNDLAGIEDAWSTADFKEILQMSPMFL